MCVCVRIAKGHGGSILIPVVVGIEKYQIKKIKNIYTRERIRKRRRRKKRKEEKKEKIKIPAAGTRSASNSGSRGSTRRRHVRYAHKPRVRRLYIIIYATTQLYIYRYTYHIIFLRVGIYRDRGPDHRTFRLLFSVARRRFCLRAHNKWERPAHPDPNTPSVRDAIEKFVPRGHASGSQLRDR